MNKERLKHFRSLLEEQLRQHDGQVRDKQQEAHEMIANDDGVKDSLDLSLQDANQELAFRLGERESDTVAEIDEALRRMDEGTYGDCERCGKPIDERRLEALPAARFDAACQSQIESRQGLDADMPTL
ncbi:MAG TPA: TraR/DksA family transcriptional regulator [Pyrinomonadaceae bacterium]|jgi:DnaK suppressor protein